MWLYEIETHQSLIPQLGIHQIQALYKKGGMNMFKQWIEEYAYPDEVHLDMVSVENTTAPRYDKSEYHNDYGRFTAEERDSIVAFVKANIGKPFRVVEAGVMIYIHKLQYQYKMVNVEYDNTTHVMVLTPGPRFDTLDARAPMTI